MADNPDDALIQISTTFQRYGEAEPYAREVSCFRETAAVEGVKMSWFPTEHECINAWARSLRDHSVDVLISYNGSQFDWRYISGRKEVLVDDDTGDELVELELLGRVLEGGGKAKEFELNSNAYGQNKFFVIETPGVQQIDVLQVLRRDVKLPSYSLDNASKHFLGEQKLDLPAAQIFDKFDGTAEDRADIARYAVRDTELPLKLLAKLSMWENLSEMANAVRVPMEYLLVRGQQIKVFSTLLGKARDMGYLLPDDKAIGVPEGVKYEGATVLDARRGAYFDIVCGLDFSSLYPSIIRAHNLCYSTLVLEGSPPDDATTVETGLGTFSFVQSRRGVVPALLEDLASFRKRAKKDMAAAEAAGDEWAASLFNAKQLAYKITMNSVYGFLGATKGMLPCVPIAASVTAIGREMIKQTKHLAETMVPGSRVVYGDSVAAYTPVIVRQHGGDPVVTTIELVAHAFGGRWVVDGSKERCELDRVDVWSEGGWTRVHRVVRHRCGKAMVRVQTPTGLVDVTEDHSLLRPDGSAAAPRDVRVGDRLLHFGEFPAFPPLTREARRACAAMELRAETQLEAATLFILASSLGRAVTLEAAAEGGFVVRTARAAPAAPTAVTSITPLPHDGGYVYDFTTANHHFAAGAGRMVVHNTDSVMVIFELGDDRRHDVGAHFQTAERVAQEISRTFKPPNELEFEKVYYPYLLFSKKRYAGEFFYVGLFAYTHAHPKHASLCSVAGPVPGPGVGGLHGGLGHLPRRGARGHGGVVHPHGTLGVGAAPVHQPGVQFQGAVGGAVAAAGPHRGLRDLPSVVDRALVNSLCVCVCVGLMYTNPAAPSKIDIKGIQLVRRDNCPLVKRVSGAVLDAIMYHKSSDAALEAARSHVAAILSGTCSVDQFVVSKTLRNDYKNDKQPHLYVARKLGQRRGFPVPSGSRVPYVFVKDLDNPDGLQADKAEDPDFVAEQGLPLDVLYYLEHQVMSPVCALLEVLVPNPQEEVFGHPSVKPLLDELRRERDHAIKVAKRLRKNAAHRQPEITAFFKPALTN